MSSHRLTASPLDAAALTSLERLIEKHFPKLNYQECHRELARCRAFTEAAIALGQHYANLRQQARDAESRRKRFEAIAVAAQQLRFAMEGLSQLELTKLEAEQSAVHQAYVGELEAYQAYDHDTNHQVSGEPFGPRPASSMLAWQDLRWLEQGAKQLSAPRRRGRPENVAERWAARKFVVLCHQHGWTPVRVAHSGSETRQDDPQASGAVMCLAAILVAGGENEVRAKSAAMSALKQLRKRFTYLEWPDCSPDDPYSDYVEPTEYSVSLKELIADRHNGIGDLPDFRPKGD